MMCYLALIMSDDEYITGEDRGGSNFYSWLLLRSSCCCLHYFCKELARLPRVIEAD